MHNDLTAVQGAGIAENMGERGCLCRTHGAGGAWTGSVPSCSVAAGGDGHRTDNG